MKPEEAARRAARIVGSQTELARQLKVRTPTVNQWCSGERPIPAARALQIEALTSAEVSRKELCPAFPWSEMAIARSFPYAASNVETSIEQLSGLGQ